MNCSLQLVCVICLLMITASSDSLAANARIREGIVYHEVNRDVLKADLYLPPRKNAVLRPAVVLIHGGGWTKGSRKLPLQVMLGHELARAGIVALSIDYRLVKDNATRTEILNQWPAAIDDCRAAVRWLKAHADEYQIDPNQIGACGDSAGGHLASLLGVQPDPAAIETSGRVQAVCNIYGPVDLTTDYAEPRFISPIDAKVLVERFIGSTQQAALQAASPLFFLDDNTPPFLIFHGRRDVIVPVKQSQLLAEKLKQLGRPVTYVEYPNEGHGFRLPTQRKMIEQTVKFFQKELRDKQSIEYSRQ